MGNLDLYEKVRSVPKEAQKPFNNGRFSGTDINPMWRIKVLTEQFGMCGIGWYYKIIDNKLEPCGEDGEVACFVDIELYVKVNGEWSQPIVGTGGNMFVSYSKKNDSYTCSDEAFKMALTDALSVATKALGIGADIYFANDTTKYTKNQVPSPAQQQTPKEAKPIDRDPIRDLKIIAITEGKNITMSQADVWMSKKYNTTIKDATEEQFGALCEALKGYVNK